MMIEILKQYGALRKDIKKACLPNEHPVIVHFLNCDDVHVLDILELLFHYVLSDRCTYLVEEFNHIFHQENIGFELTPYEEILGDEESQPENPYSGGRRPYRKYPEIICKTGQYVHESIVRPCLDVLAKPLFSGAEKEMLKAHQHYRNNLYEDSLTSCGSAFESVLKIICTEKGWPLPERPTLGPLLQTCVANGLFSEPYKKMLQNSGDIRNLLSTAHGRGSSPPVVTKETVDYMIQITSANITLVAKLADL